MRHRVPLGTCSNGEFSILERRDSKCPTPLYIVRDVQFSMPIMNPQDESEIRAIIALHREIEEKKKEISKRLAVIRDRERAIGNQDALMFVVDGEIWQMKRWAEIEPMVTPLSFDAWCLQYKGKAL